MKAKLIVLCVVNQDYHTQIGADKKSTDKQERYGYIYENIVYWWNRNHKYSYF